MIKRGLDILLAVVVLVVLSPLLLFSALAIKVGSPGPIFHRAPRLARRTGTFNQIRFRTMTRDAAAGSDVTALDDPRITRVGAVLRSTGLADTPQLVNVLRGEMSVVGPRPEDPRYATQYAGYQDVLSVRPGILSPAYLAFRDESTFLQGQEAATVYAESVLPEKLRLDREYVRSASTLADMAVVLRGASLLLTEAYGPTAAVLRVLRRLPWEAIDGIIAVVGYLLAYLLLRLDAGQTARLAPGWLAVLVAAMTVVHVAGNRAFGLNRRVWRYATAQESAPVLGSVLLAVTIGLGLDALFRVPIPAVTIVVGGFCTAAGFIGVRYRPRAKAVRRARFSSGEAPARGARTRSLVYGAGETGQQLALRLLSQAWGQTYDVVGFIDDDSRKHGKTIHGIEVLGGRDALGTVVKDARIDLVILAMPNIGTSATDEILAVSEQSAVQIRMAPDPLDWKQGAPPPPFRELQIEDLIGRSAVSIDREACLRVVSGVTTLVTGACGSIGSELCRQLAALAPTRLVLLDNNESGVFDLRQELLADHPAVEVVAVVADVTSRAAILRALTGHSPRNIFHVAAYKHVPLMEDYPLEALRVNLLGSDTVLEVAREVGVGRFVLVSTDKAVNSSSVMGATKRLAELIVTAERPGLDGEPDTLCTAVRFGNVLGSRGSVVPTFARQIDQGGPVTVTDAEMTRYFMAVSEAASLIIEAATLTSGHDLFMLEMVRTVRIDDLARKMIRMRGLRPDIDVPIVYTGMRPGEKLHEELRLPAEERSPTAHPSIYRLEGEDRLSQSEAESLIVSAEALLAAGDPVLAATRLRAMAASPRDGLPLGAGDSGTRSS